MNEKGKLIVISGPSGAGKSTVVFKSIEGKNNVCFSTSVTTRKPRPGEVDGKEYFFVDLDRFREMVENDELLEHAEYVANSYGTPRSYVEQKLSDGMDVILDIEVQGARQVNEKMPDAVKVFIIPPSMDELKRRLESRGTDTARAIEARLIRARQEYKEADFYDYIIVNDDADKAAGELSAIMTAERCRAVGREQHMVVETPFDLDRAEDTGVDAERCLDGIAQGDPQQRVGRVGQEFFQAVHGYCGFRGVSGRGFTRSLRRCVGGRLRTALRPQRPRR